MTIRTIILFYAISFSQLIVAQAGQKCDSLTIYFGHDEKTPITFSGLVDSIFNNTDKIEIKIYGYTDHLGSDEYNKNLSQQRADAIATVIKSRFTNVVMKECVGRGEIETDAAPEQRIPEHRKVVAHYCKTIREAAEMKENKTVELQTIQKEEWKTGEKIELQGLNFQPGLTKLIPQSENILSELEQKMKENPTLKIEIQGHVCCLDDNLKDGLDHATGRYDLSVGRAKRVYDYLIEKGISPDRMTYAGYSNKAPKMWPELTDAHRAANRRVEILVISE